MLYTNGKDVDLTKYNRFFVFGCSFTNYRWPTWADIIAKQIPTTKYINAGKSGAGQMYIVSQLNQAFNHYNIGEGDLVAIMWSTFFREDRYNVQQGGWRTPGNIFTQQDYPQEFVDNYVCRRGFMMRDLALIDTTMRMLEGASCDSFAALGVSLEDQNWYAGMAPGADEEQLRLQEVIDMYSGLSSKLMPTLKDTEYPDGWRGGYAYQDTWGWNEDYHPTVPRYLAYLEKIGFRFDETVHEYVADKHEKMKTITSIEELYRYEKPPMELL